MIASIAEIKQHRTNRQARQVKSLEIALSDLRERRSQSAHAFTDFQQWRRRESDRLFAELAGKPASLQEVDDYNSRVTYFKVQSNDLASQLKQIQAQETAAEQKLQAALDQLKAAQRAQEKFAILAEDFQGALQQNRIRLEEQQAEEMAADSLRCPAGATAGFSLGMEASR
ncbi:hypothetical protein HCH_03267 [Hahella chejuensis KCTC 2396]|uniref:Uncharacterized protein n=1 Tax=Hahella chejuensis (strain KCTC 2396) TaxID=349521 RepID=Q2SH49_HAHCH|nr:type III secretion protein [Hahella chejuensis]ABC30025.1 hypothetical protein HCH_03267 [Hahella chejuensis KCTC 2396]